MCHGPDALPAVPPIEDRALLTRSMTLTASDGNVFSAFSARPDAEWTPGVVVLPDNRGLGPFYQELAKRIAELGYSAIAIDYYGRTAGTSPRPDDFPFMQHLMKVTRPGLEADFLAAVDFLRSSAGGNCRSTFAIGFCFGGRQAYLAATLGLGLAGVIGFYGFPGTINNVPGPTARASEIASPVLAIWAGADNIGSDQIHAFTEALHAGGIPYQSVVYPGAPHSFFDVHQLDWQEASADAWSRVRSFFEQYQTPRDPDAAP